MFSCSIFLEIYERWSMIISLFASLGMKRATFVSFLENGSHDFSNRMFCLYIIFREKEEESMVKKTKIKTTRLASDIISGILEITRIDWFVVVSKIPEPAQRALTVTNNGLKGIRSHFTCGERYCEEDLIRNSTDYLKKIIFSVARDMKIFVHKGWDSIEDIYRADTLKKSMELIRDLLCPAISEVVSTETPLFDPLGVPSYFVPVELMEYSSELSHNITLFLEEMGEHFPI